MQQPLYFFRKLNRSTPQILPSGTGAKEVSRRRRKKRWFKYWDQWICESRDKKMKPLSIARMFIQFTNIVQDNIVEIDFCCNPNVSSWDKGRGQKMKHFRSGGSHRNQSFDLSLEAVGVNDKLCFVQLIVEKIACVFSSLWQLFFTIDLLFTETLFLD